MSGRGNRGGRGAGRGADRGGPSRGAPPGRGGPPPRGGGSGFRGARGGFQGGGRGGGPSGPAPEPVTLPPAVIDARLTDNALDKVTQGLAKLKIEGGGGELPVRPGFGTLGKAIKLRANYFPVQKFPAFLYEYEVKIEPGIKPKRVKRRIFDLLDKSPEFSQYAPYTANDGASKMIASKALDIPAGGLDVAIDHFDEDEPEGPRKKFVCTISRVAEHETKTLQKYLNGEPGLHNHDTGPVIAAFNIVILKHAIDNGGVNVGRNRYFFPQAQESIDSCVVAMRGFYLSVRPTFKQLSMNLNVATTAFYKPGNLAVALDNYANSTYNANATAFVKGLRVKTKHLGYKKAILRVGHRNAKQETFDHPQYGKVSVEAYFQKMYKITLKRPQDPLVDIGSKAKTNWVPAELCDILPNQPYRLKLSGQQTSAMLNIACRPPDVNQADIYRNGLTNMGVSPLSPNLVNFGITLGDQMAVVPARILNPPKIAYGSNKIMDVRDSAWNLRDVRFFKGAKIQNCMALALSESGRDFQGPSDPAFLETVKGFAAMCKTCGLDAGTNKWVYGMVEPTRRNVEKTMVDVEAELKKLPGRPNLVLVVLPSDDKVLYSAVKTLLDCKLGVINVCVQAQKFRKQQPQYYANVALKVNMKLGGVNHVLNGPGVVWLKQKKTMLMGADVTHPSPGSLIGTPSIAAVVASVDDSFGQYPCSMELQESRKEMITNLGQMTIERLKAYEAKNGKGQFPQRIIMFRDGVSEGQFLTVVHEELPKVKDACKRVATNYNPTITYVIAGKRHHTRFYPVDAEGRDDRNNGNPKTGTVVDKGVTGVYTFDFFLQSHVGLKGHARPTHYTVVHDENKFTADELQRLCHEMCHTFARATRGVSLIPPAYYADLACERGRCYIHNLLNSDSSTVAGSRNTADEAASNYRKAEMAWGNGPHTGIRNVMYYI